MSKTPSQLRKNGHSSDIGPDFITSTAVEAVADDEPDVTSPTRSPHKIDIIKR